MIDVVHGLVVVVVVLYNHMMCPFDLTGEGVKKLTECRLSQGVSTSWQIIYKLCLITIVTMCIAKIKNS